MRFLSKFNSAPQFSRGFSLMELLVVLAIFTVMTGVLLANLPEFREKTNLDLLAHQMAINIRQAQVYGVSIKSASEGLVQFPWYGIHFAPSAVRSNPVEFWLITHKPETTPTGYNPADDILQTRNKILGGYSISGVCGYIGATADCAAGERKDLRIIFARPNPEARFYLTDDLGTVSRNLSYSEVRITLKANRSGREKVVRIFANGQIIVANADQS